MNFPLSGSQCDGNRNVITLWFITGRTNGNLLLFSAAQQDRISSSANALVNIYGAAGEEVSISCGFSFSGAWKIFCRENCEGGNILIETRQPTAQRGRYRTECVEEASPNGVFSLYVSISALTRSDEGWYRCGLGDSSSSVSYQDFRLVVVDASTPSTGTSFSSSSGSFTPSLPSETSGLNQENSTSKGSPTHRSADVLRFVVLTLVVIILSSLLLLVCCRKRSEKHTKNPPATEKNSKMKDDVTEEADEWRSADVEIYSAYTETTNTKPTEAETNRGCSSAAASQQPTEDVSVLVVYAEVKFSSRKAASRPRASCGTVTDVLYADPRADGSSHDESLYSTIT
ncbi:uncharacterized protein LOC103468117 isoform X5 [Poecilia reticulata]|uniref:uncharacterized protein LOC103468117 isoform X5 n=1 Tax=Poecilia reticulata TaxID=8081 RepID=UPI0007EB6FA7|nr:PREDICTED: uncharacterized protein LOC103468117 isoform X5 [Poecilia reticulata]